MKRHLLSVLAVAAVASFAGAQEGTPATTTQQPTAGAETSAKKTTKSPRKARRYTTTSRGEIDRGGPGYSLRAVARDYVCAEDTSGDDLWRREQMMDQRCGKNRERCGKP